MPLPERLLVVQDLMEKGDERAAQIYETIGVYLGSTLPLYTEFYDFRNVLLLGRVLTGKGGEIIIERSRKVYGKLDPKRAAQISIQVPDEKSRRVGQAVAAASLPKRS
jgi:predicted NBD/HSP70 family sugar kinase